MKPTIMSIGKGGVVMMLKVTMQGVIVTFATAARDGR